MRNPIQNTSAGYANLFNYLVSTSTIVWAFTPEQVAELTIKLLIGLPPATYMCFKIYHEFLKKRK